MMADDPQKIFGALKNFVILVLSVAFLISLKQCSDREDSLDGMEQYIASRNDTITYLKNGMVAQKSAIEVSDRTIKSIIESREELKKALEDSRLKARNVRSITTIVSDIKTDTIKIILTDTLPCADFAPITFNVDSTHYSIGGLISKKSVQISKVSFPDSLIIITASKKHFLKKNEFLVSASHSNPLIRTNGLENLTVKDDRKWWEKRWIYFAAGVVGGGYLVGKL